MTDLAAPKTANVGPFADGLAVMKIPELHERGMSAWLARATGLDVLK